MSRKFFGTDGIRGQMGEEPITPETILKLGWAAGKVLSRQEGPGNAKILIGKDTRVSGYLLESALEAGLTAAGADTCLLGPLPTPGIAYLTRTSRARAGIVISASHNPYEDNGIKFFSPQGNKLPDEVELAIEAMMDQPLKTVPAAELGKARRYDDAVGRYVEFCKSTFPSRFSLEGLKVVVDCANGAAYHVAPLVFSELGADVIPIAVEPDGFNINRECGATHPETLVRAVRENGAHLGLALDGDGDRLIMADSGGQIVDGDRLIHIIAISRQGAGRLQGGVVGTVMSNLGLEHGLAQRNIPFKRAAVGDRYVNTMLLHEGWVVGGESSGHILLLDKSPTGDGIIAALEVLAEIVQTGHTLGELAAGMHIYPQKMINVRMARKFDVRESGTVQDAVKAAESELGDNGRIVLRASGTEPVVRVMVEGRDVVQVERLAADLASVVGRAAETSP